MFTICLISLILIGTIVLLGYYYLILNFGYWKKRGVTEAKAKAFVGSLPNSFNQKKHMIYDIRDIYNQYKKDENYVGIFMVRNPELLILEPSLAHEIFVTKFKNFHDNGASALINKDVDDVMGNNPFFLKGEEWKEKRFELSPALTSNRVKASFPVMQQVCNKMSNYIKNELIKSPKECTIDTKDLANRFTAEVVSDCIYGFDAGCFTNKDSEILNQSKKLVDDLMNAFMIFFITMCFPVLSRIWTPKIFSQSSRNFYTKLFDNAVKLRLQSKSDRTDFLNYLLQLKEKKNLTNFDLTVHSLTFFIDGYETSATLISHCLLLLARNIEVQNRLRDEIENNLEEDNTLSFDKINDMKYLDQCIQESLRIFAPVGFLSKICTEPTEFENTNERILKVKIGDIVNLPIASFHHDEQYFPKPEEFIPERFSDENGGAKKYKDEGKFLPFGDGPRICIGQKFGMTQSKAAICEIIKNFEITLNERTRKDNVINPKNMFTLLEGGIWLNYKEIKN